MRMREWGIRTLKDAPSQVRGTAAKLLVRSGLAEWSGSSIRPTAAAAVVTGRLQAMPPDRWGLQTVTLPDGAPGVLAAGGPLALLHCGACGGSAGRDSASHPPAPDTSAPAPLHRVHTPGVRTNPELAACLGIPLERTAKILFCNVTYPAGQNELVGALLRGDRRLSMAKLQACLGAVSVRLADKEEVAARTGAPFGSAGPVGLKAARVVADSEVAATCNLVFGANEEDYHLANVNVGRDYTADLVADIRQVQPGDACPACGGALREAQAAAAADTAAVLQALAARHADARGLRWPDGLAPFAVAVVPVDAADPAQREAAERIDQDLVARGIRTLLDDRAERAGAKFKDAELLGLPWRVVVGARGLAEGVAEVVCRDTGRAENVPLGQLVPHLARALVRIRPYNRADIPELIRLQEECFPPPYPAEQLWNAEQLRGHIGTFPDGALCAEVDGRIVASGTCLIVRLDPKHPDHSWSEITGDGTISTHDPSGDTLYGVDLCVHPAYRGFGMARLIYEARYALVRRLGLRRFCAGGRMPGYHRLADELTAEEYVRRVAAGNLTDPTLTPQLRSGLRPVAVLRGYIPDAESRDHALLLEWPNPEVA